MKGQYIKIMENLSVKERALRKNFLNLFRDCPIPENELLINLEVRKEAPIEGWASASQIYEFLGKHGFKPSVLLAQLHQKHHQKLHKVKHEDVVFVSE